MTPLQLSDAKEYCDHSFREQDSGFSIDRNHHKKTRKPTTIRFRTMVIRSHFHSVALLVPFLQISSGKPSTMKTNTPPLGDVRKLEDYSETELQYFSECEDTLLSEAVIDDGLISQQEFASTFNALCKAYAIGGGCPDGGFEDLSSDLQSLFFEAVCDGMPDPAQCVVSLNSMGSMSLGYIVSAETAAAVQMHVGDMCLELLDHAFATGTVSTTSSATDPAPSPPVLETSVLGRPTAENESISLPNNEGSGNAPREPVQKPESKPQNESQEILDLTAVDSDPAQGIGLNFNDISNTDGSFTHGPIVGIAVVAAACLLLLLLVAYRKRHQRQLHVKGMPYESDGESTTDSDPEAPNPYPQALVVKKVKGLPQYDVSATAASIALKMPSDVSTASRSTFGRRFMLSPKTVSVDQVEEAVDNGNWDDVYKLASQLAEKEDLSTLSSAARHNAEGLSNDRLERRSSLREEDQERAKTLDELIFNRDWTGVAVTAALYAGESGYQTQIPKSSGGNLFGRIAGRRVSNAAHEASSQDFPTYQDEHPALGALTIESTSDTTNDVESPPEPPSAGLPFLQLKNSMDQAVDAGDWDQVLRISSEVENNGAFQSRHADQQNNIVVSVPSNTSSTELPSPSGRTEAFQTLIDEMDNAMNRGDWALVGFYADKIREIKISGDVTTSTPSSRALVPLSRPQALKTSPTEDSSSSIASKKFTLEKLVQAEKWKGVSIMAGLYEMEAKNSASAASSESS